MGMNGGLAASIALFVTGMFMRALISFVVYGVLFALCVIVNDSLGGLSLTHALIPCGIVIILAIVIALAFHMSIKDAIGVGACIDMVLFTVLS
jgi:hypothetical protein